MIDLAITTLQTSAVSKWNTLGPFGNDHYPCTIFVRRGKTCLPKRPPRVFQYPCKNDDPVSKVRQQVRTSGKSKPPPIKQPPWWNDELEALWNDKRKALKESQRTSSDQELRNAARQASNMFKSAANEAKSKKYEEFCQEVTADKAMHKFWKLYGAMKNKQKSKSIPDFQRDDNIWVRSDEEKGEALFNRYLTQTDQDNELERKKHVE